ncbi:hypothetical protein PpBr36_00667 [Pyricularia pennisetigena]|uniref:hypothetical protein n=1 Tax=Pyricularia pennisetigena TaxID=1578925 RepID=UPI0011521012|nr:hypothetical protein PpBr36_00667 [Pyricularia pennisetigena]TLS29596.1 hypothetical protein PpBr36_00667 [Pyricularia pennisetigena]
MDTAAGITESQRSSSPEDGTYRPPKGLEDGYDSAATAGGNGSRDGDYQADPDSSEWDLDTDDVRSISSTELREARPNRWKGPAPTWRALTEQDRLTYEAFVSLRNQDLSAHLYTAFALKRRGQMQGSGDAETENDAEDEEDGDFDAVTGTRVRGSDWVPPKSWTAWPLRSHLVPRDYELMSGSASGDPLDSYTLRRTVVLEEGSSRPAAALEDLLCATMIRTATDRFRRRQALGHVDSENNPICQHDHQERPGSPGGQSEGGEWPNSSPPSAQLHLSSPPLASPTHAIEDRTYIPSAATDDDKSHALLRPAARRILDSLDATLLRLHDARVCATMDLSETSGTSSSEQEEKTEPSEHESATSGSRKRKRGRPRSKNPIVRPKFMEPEKPGRGNKRRVGRPRRVYVPLDGETENEMLIRVAKERHERIPVFSDSKENSCRETSTDGGSTDKKPAKSKSSRSKGSVILKLEGETERQYQVRVARTKHLKLPEFLSDDEDAPQDATQSPRQDVLKTELSSEMEVDEKLTTDEAAERKIRQKKKTMSRWPLRNWSDVVGAASLAGFSPAVVARVTQRCANLFGQSMEMHTITEAPVAGRRKRKRTGMVTKEYRPGGSLSETSLTSGGEDGSDTHSKTSDGSASLIKMQRLRSLSREPALRGDVIVGSSSDDGSDRKAIARGRGRRASSAAAADAGFFCPHAACSRFIKAFTRRDNLARHMNLVHGEANPGYGQSRSRSQSRGPAQNDQDGGEDDEFEGGEDSADEMDGAVHVDGFLKPIKIRQGWRAEDFTKRRDKGEPGGTRRQGRSRRGRRDSDGYES